MPACAAPGEACLRDYLASLGAPTRALRTWVADNHGQRSLPDVTGAPEASMRDRRIFARRRWRWPIEDYAPNAQL
jgi:hypothetical protein